MGYSTLLAQMLLTAPYNWESWHKWTWPLSEIREETFGSEQSMPREGSGVCAR